VIDSIQIKDFRCIRSAKIDLAPLTVFVGPNGSGKSTIVDALDPQHSRQGVTTWRRLNGRAAFVASVDGRTTDWTGDTSHPYAAQILHLQPDRLRRANTVARADRLALDGSNLANLIATLTRREQEALSKTACTLIPVIGDVDVQPVANGQHQLRFQDRWAPEVWYAPSEVSDGTMLVIAFLALQYQPATVDLLAIEDAEHALHPYLLSELVKLLRKLAMGQLGPRKIQVVATTHSAELLDYLEPNEVRFVSRNPSDGSVTVDAVDTTTPSWKQTYEEYKHSLADVWLSGGAGGV